mgnify:CR=1 FL=1
MFKRFDIFDLVFGFLMIIGVGMIVFPLTTLPKSYEANRLCNENGYTQFEWYLDGVTYCSRKGELGKDEVVRIK